MQPRELNIKLRSKMENKRIIAKYAGFELNGKSAYTVVGSDGIFTEDLLKQQYGENFVFEEDLRRKEIEEWDEFRMVMIGGFK